MKKAVITVVGKDTVGIIARICTSLSRRRANILDISQTIVSGYFNMMMVVDIGESADAFDAVAGDLAAIGRDMGLKIRCQNAEIFEKMHRI